jgi:hypothetical protein
MSMVRSDGNRFQPAFKVSRVLPVPRSNTPNRDKYLGDCDYNSLSRADTGIHPWVKDLPAKIS